MNYKVQFGIPKRNYPHRLNFESDYDIQKANEQFQRALLGQNVVIKTLEELKKSMDDEALYKSNVPNFNIFYDKTKSFFDNISCETREKQEGRNVRPDWKKERLTNQETFGPFAVRSQQAFYRSNLAVASGLGGHNNPANMNYPMRWQPPPGQHQFMRFQQRNVRPDWKKERSTNQETFGPFAVRSQQAFYRSNSAVANGLGGPNPANLNRPMRWQPPPGQHQFMRFPQ